jgi:hypothetical protein
MRQPVYRRKHSERANPRYSLQQSIHRSTRYRCRAQGWSRQFEEAGSIAAIDASFR